VACALGVGLLVAGCYSPQVKNGGFACIATDDPPCPKGFYCVNGLCVDNPALADDLSVTGDMTLPVSDFAGGPDLLRSGDLASTSTDMASATCGMSGDQCITQNCCSGLSCLFVCI